MGKRAAATLRNLQPDCHPRQVIAALAEDLLAHYAAPPLLDPYDVYQHLMNYCRNHAGRLLANRRRRLESRNRACAGEEH